MTTPLADSPAAALGQEVAAARAEASPAWLAARRRIAWDAYEAIPMPSSQRDEDWRRTDISALHPERFAPIDACRRRGRRRDARAARRRRAHAAFVIDSPVAGADRGSGHAARAGNHRHHPRGGGDGAPRAGAARVRLGARRRVEVRRAVECAVARRRLRVRPARRRGARPGLDRSPRGRRRPRGLPVHGGRPRRGRVAHGHRRLRIAGRDRRRCSATPW